VQQSSQALTNFAQNQYIYLNSLVRLVGPIVTLSCIDIALGIGAITGFVIICAAVLRFDRTMINLAREENDAKRRYAPSMTDALGKSTSLVALIECRFGYRVAEQGDRTGRGKPYRRFGS
jgi:ATP-binding cassette subfamily B protein